MGVRINCVKRSIAEKYKVRFKQFPRVLPLN